MKKLTIKFPSVGQSQATIIKKRNKTVRSSPQVSVLIQHKKSLRYRSKPSFGSIENNGCYGKQQEQKLANRRIHAKKLSHQNISTDNNNLVRVRTQRKEESFLGKQKLIISWDQNNQSSLFNNYFIKDKLWKLSQANKTNFQSFNFPINTEQNFTNLSSHLLVKKSLSLDQNPSNHTNLQISYVSERIRRQSIFLNHSFWKNKQSNKLFQSRIKFIIANKDKLLVSKQMAKNRRYLNNQRQGFPNHDESINSQIRQDLKDEITNNIEMLKKLSQNSGMIQEES